MTSGPAGVRHGEQGFSLIEALVALALTGLVLSALATLTAQWLPGWNRGLERIQQSELIGISMQRIAADLAAAEFVPAGRGRRKPLFDGSALSITLVRTAIGPNAGVGLDVVRIGESTDQGRLVTVRARAPFAPIAPGVSPTEQIRVADPVVLLRAPLRLSFAYAGPDRVFRDDWHDMDKLPATIMLTLRDAASERVLSVSTVAPVHVNAPPRAEKSDETSSDDATDAAKDSGKDSGKIGNQPSKPGGSS
jgi:general secretion pathway protein J